MTGFEQMSDEKHGSSWSTPTASSPHSVSCRRWSGKPMWGCLPSRAWADWPITYLRQSGEPQHGIAWRILDLIEVQLKCVGGGPTLDFQDATEFLARFQPAINAALRRRLQ